MNALLVAAAVWRLVASDYVTYDPNNILGQGSTAVAFQGFSKPITGYLLTSGFSVSNVVANYAGSALIWEFAWSITMARLSGDPSKTVVLALSNSIGDLGSFSLTLNSNGISVTPQNSCSTSTTNSITTATCTSGSGQRYSITANTGASGLGNISVGSGANVATGYTAYTVQLTYTLTPSAAANTNSMNFVERIQLSVTYAGTAQLPISFQNFVMSLTPCPSSCLSCSSANTCSTCLSGFYVVGGNCTCAGTLVSYHARDYNSLNTGADQTFYFGTTSCITVNQFNSQITSAQNCQNLLSSLLLSNQIILQSSQSLANSGINIVFTANSSTVATISNSSCFNQTMFVNAIGVGTRSPSWPLDVAVTSENTLTLNQQYPVVLPSTAFCSFQNYTSFGLSATVCPIDTIFFMRSVGFNSTLAVFQSRLITITGSSASGKTQLFIPIFANNPNVTMQVNGNFSAVLCLDSNCANVITGQSIMATQALWVRVVFYDPLINYYTPQVFATLSVDGKDATSYLQSTSLSQQFSYTAVLYQINLQTVTSPVTMVFNLTMTVSITTPATYNSQSNLVFSLQVIPKQVIIVPFQNSLRFFVLVFTVALAIFLIVIGLLFYWIDKARGPRSEYMVAPGSGHIAPVYPNPQPDSQEANALLTNANVNQRLLGSNRNGQRSFE